VFEAVNAGSSATDAIKLVEPEVEVPSEVSQAPPSAAAEPPSGGAGSEGAEPGVSPFVRSALERLQAALQGAGPIAAIRGAHIAKSSEAVHVRQALIAALDAIGISRYREDEEGAQGPASGPRTIAFGLEFEPGQRVMVEVRYLATTRETGGPRLLIRAFDLDAGKVPEAALDAVAEFVARANFGLNYGALQCQAAGCRQAEDGQRLHGRLLQHPVPYPKLLSFAPFVGGELHGSPPVHLGLIPSRPASFPLLPPRPQASSTSTPRSASRPSTRRCGCPSAR
jgi:hypothetical protein